MITTFVILGITIVLFISDKLRMDIVALLALLALYLTGVLEPNQLFTGFADNTVIIITGLFVVGAGLFKTGVAAWIARQLLRVAGADTLRLLIVLMLGTAFLSAFMSNTGTVAVLLPAVVAVAGRLKLSPAKLLMPLAIAANIGGLLTLIGTLPNIVVSDALVAAGERPLNFFEFAWVGLPLLGLGVGYMVIVGRFMLPERTVAATDEPPATVDELEQDYQLGQFLFRLTMSADSTLVGQTLSAAAIGQTHRLSVLHIKRTSHSLTQQMTEAEEVIHPEADTVIRGEDEWLIKGKRKAVAEFAAQSNLTYQQLSATEQKDVEANLLTLTEVLIPHRSTLIGRTLADAQIAQKYGGQVLAVLRGGQRLPTYRTAPLAFGDSLLIHGTPEAIGLMRNERRNFVVVSEAVGGETKLGRPALFASAAMLMMLVLILFKIVPMAVAVVLTGLVMVLTRCLTMEQAYRAINWESVVLIAAMLPMSTALQQTGGAAFIVDGLIGLVGGNFYLLLAGVFLLTAAFTQVTSNTATSVLLAPIAISAAQNLGVSPITVVMMVVVGASSAFATPIASPVNMLVLNPGGYRFADFSRVGLPLVGIFLLTALALVPLIWGG